ncbi:MAG: glycosyltransferase, partial [Pseudomonadota bacterium]|nr:glycosyltransferase [Pseudomonadota bacterium]
MSASHIPHGGKDKLVSVICRTVGRATLANTLDSLARQNHPALEVILVDAGGTNLEDKIPPDFLHQIKHVGSGTTLSRPEAANLGLESSSGEYLLFLDDDDWIAAEHISNLVTTLIDNSKVIVAYSSTAKVTEQGELTDLAFNQDYDPVLLMRDNYIPIHAALFRRSVLEQGCRFDPELEIYEDWDFWLQLTQLGNFLHIDVTSAFYREGGESETGAANSDNRYSPDTPLGAFRAKLYQKWKGRWSGEQLNALVGKSLAESTIQELHDEILRKDKAFDKVSKRLQSTEDKFLKLENQHAAEILTRSSAEKLVDRLNSEVDRLTSEKAQSEHAFRNRLAELTMQVKQLERAHALIEDSLFWRATYPLRQVRNWFHRVRTDAVSEALKPELESSSVQTRNEPPSVKATYSVKAKR